MKSINLENVIILCGDYTNTIEELIQEVSPETRIGIIERFPSIEIKDYSSQGYNNIVRVEELSLEKVKSPSIIIAEVSTYEELKKVLEDKTDNVKYIVCIKELGDKKLREFILK